MIDFPICYMQCHEFHDTQFETQSFVCRSPKRQKKQKPLVASFIEARAFLASFLEARVFLASFLEARALLASFLETRAIPAPLGRCINWSLN